MIDGLNMNDVISRIKYSGLSFTSRQLVYSKLINEVWNYKSYNLKECVGIDNAFDSVYLNSNGSMFDEDCVGC